MPCTPTECVMGIVFVKGVVFIKLILHQSYELIYRAHFTFTGQYKFSVITLQVFEP